MAERFQCDFDVVIIGAGAAGIAAARKLHGAGRSVVLIEASQRIGGRAWTMAVDGMALDLGCGWLHSAERNPWAALGEATGFTIDRSDSAWRHQWRDLGFPPAERADALRAFEQWSERLEHDPPPSDRASDAIDPECRWNAYLQALSGYINGARMERLSIADYLAYDQAASEMNWRVREGYGTLVAASLPPVTLRLASPVEAVRLDSGGVRIDGPRGAVRTRFAIVTISTTMLARGAIRFEPAVDDHLHAASQLPLGIAEKLFLVLEPGHGLEPETHLLGNPREPLTASYYIRPFGYDAIECFFGGLGAEAANREGLSGAFAFAIDELAALIGNDIRSKLRPLIGSGWARTRFIGGSYSHALPGHAGARAILARPIGQRLFFAGEATHATDFSTAHGAWESGVRAADEVIAAAR